MVALWMALLMLPLAPLNNRFSGAGVLLFVAVAFATRNILAIGVTSALLNVACRLLIQNSSWQDQHWVQWSSISSLLTGHNLFSTSPLYRFSLSSYMPAGDLFGGLLIALGIQRYWLIWHVLVVCLVALPVMLSPSFATLLIFIAFSCFYPFCDYTTAGGTLEIGYALAIASIALFRSRRLLTASIVMFAFSAMFRQPALTMIPFLALILWRAHDFRRFLLFAVLLSLFGGIYIVTDPAGAYHYLYEVWNEYHQEIFNDASGLQRNYSISALPHALGIADAVTWYRWNAFYPPITLAGIAVLFGIAWFRKSAEEILFLGMLSSIATYLLSRGYAQFIYVCTAFFPLVAFAYPLTSSEPLIGRRFAQCLSMVLVWFGAAPAVLAVAGLAIRMVDEARPSATLHAAATQEILPTSQVIGIAPMNGADAPSHILAPSAALQFQLPSPEYVTGIRLSCDQIPIQSLKGVLMPYPTEVQMRGAITEGLVEGSEDGRQFFPVRHFYNAATYCIWPVTIPLLRTQRPVTFLRLRPIKLYLDQQQWNLGNVEFIARR